MDRVAQGGSLTLSATFEDDGGNLIDPTTPLIDVLDPSSVVIVTDAVPVRLSTGRYTYTYSPANNAVLGLWSVHWTGTVQGGPVNADEVFEVVEPGSLAPAGRQRIINMTRLIFRDYGQAFRDNFIGTGTLKFFDLSEANIDADTLTVTVAGVVKATPADYTLDERDGSITFGTAPAANATIVAYGRGNMFTLDEDMGAFVDIAFDLHAKGRTPALTYDSISPAEEYVIALLAVRESLWSQVVEAGNQVDVSTPEGMHIPGGAHYRQLMDMIDRVDHQYRDLAGVLNVGPWAIEMFTLRRISRTTNKLVPLYVPQEFDDHSPPVRLYPSIDQGGGSASAPGGGVDGGAP